MTGEQVERGQRTRAIMAGEWGRESAPGLGEVLVPSLAGSL